VSLDAAEDELVRVYEQMLQPKDLDPESEVLMGIPEVIDRLHTAQQQGPHLNRFYRDFQVGLQ
jgi:hypothetical protein